MGQNNAIPNFANLNLFKVAVGDAAFVVPDTVEQVSPAGAATGGISSSGLSPVNLFNSKRAGVGGYIYAAVSDAAGPASIDFQAKINPNDSIAVTFGGGVVTVTITDVNGNARVATQFAATATGQVLGYYS